MKNQKRTPIRVSSIFSIILAFIIISIFGSCLSNKSNAVSVIKTRHISASKSKPEGKKEKEGEEEEEGKDKYDGPEQAAAFEFMRTKDPATGNVPSDRLMEAMEVALRKKGLNTRSALTSLSWFERGPYSDIVGTTNNNKRPNNDITAGRIRAVWVDKSDASGKTVWVGGVDGGLWKTTDITSATPNWVLISDFFSNMAVTSICQDPTNPNIMYFGTGEAFFNADAVQGVGVFKSTDGGVTWSILPSTSTFVFCTKILCDASGNVYMGTRNGFMRSTDGGSTWANITPTGFNVRVADFEISSTGRLHLSCGIFSLAFNPTAPSGYAFTDAPSTVTSATWTSPTTPLPVGSIRCELACLGNTLYAVSSTTSYTITQVHKSIDGGANWTTTNLTSSNISTFGSGQAWYNIGLGIDQSNADNVMLGGLMTLKSTDGGATWTKISEWVGTTGQYVHADIHNILWYDGGSKVIITCDGGVHYSADQGATFRDRNTNLRIKQFYSCAIHPTLPNYFLAGAQDNGTHQQNGAGIASSVEVTGGDGAFVAIDQNQPQFQFAAYVFNQYRKSLDGGATWVSANFSTSAGLFINPWDYDDINNKIYASHNAGRYLRWDNPTVNATGSGITASIPAFNGATVSAVKVSPFTQNQVYFGTNGGRIIKMSNAHTSTPTVTNITAAAMPVGTFASCINTGTDDNNLIACFSNYGVSSIWATTDGGTNWTAIEGNLPDMPVRWVMYFPYDNTKAYAATETGVWETDLINGASTVWTPNSTFPTVKTTMLKYRASDHTIIASTHGRGLWTATVPVPTTTVTINTAPATNLNITVDGTNYVSPQTFTWDVNSPHTIATTTPQSPTADATYTFANWSDAGAISHTVIAPASPTTYTANFSAKYLLTLTSNATCGTISPETALYDAGNVVITATPSANYTFLGFTGGLTGTTNPQTLNLTAPTTVNASFSIEASVTINAMQSNVICAGESVTFKTTATNGGTTPQYKWFVNGNEVAGQSGTTFTSSTLVNGDKVKVQMITDNVPCVVKSIVESNEITMTVNPLPMASLVTTTPTICSGSSATFVVTTAPDNIIYYSVNGGMVTSQLTTNNSTSIVLPNVTTTTSMTLVSVKNNSTGCSAVINSTATVNIATQLTPSVNNSATNTTICAGISVTFTATPTNGGATPQYKWFKNGSEIIGETNSTLVTTSLSNGDKIKVELTTSLTCVTQATVTSNELTMTVKPLPTINCPQNITENSTTGQCGKTITYISSSTTIPLPDITYTFTGATTGNGNGDGSGSFFNIGETTVTLTATNSCGTVNCTFKVTIIDNEKPNITCPANITKDNDSGICGANVIFKNAPATDNCSVTVSQTSGSVSNSVFPIGESTVSFTATDLSNNTAVCSLKITIIDIEKPIITCPANISVNNDLGVCGAKVVFNNPTAIDNCSATVTQTSGLVSGSVFPIGESTVGFTAADPSNNTAACSFKITVADTEKPVISCPQNQIIALGSFECSRVVLFADPSVSDNCSATLERVDNLTNLRSGSSITPGNYTLKYKATDPSSNKAECSFNIEVRGQLTSGRLKCTPTLTVSLDDNQCINVLDAGQLLIDGTYYCINNYKVEIENRADLTAPANYLTSAYLGQTVKAVVTDASNASCFTMVTVVDNKAPVIYCQQDTIISCADLDKDGNILLNLGQPNILKECSSVSVRYQDKTLSVPCGQSFDSQPAGFPLDRAFNLTSAYNSSKIIIRTYTITDKYNNSTTCQRVIYVKKIALYQVECPADVVVNCERGITNTNPQSVTSNGFAVKGTGYPFIKNGRALQDISCSIDLYYSDVTSALSNNQGSTIQRTWTMTNRCTQERQTCIQLITVLDTKPTVVCKENTSISINLDKKVRVFATDIASASDNCTPTNDLNWGIKVADTEGGFPTTNSLTFNCIDLGIKSVQIFVKDGAGNTSSCTSTIKIIDNNNYCVTTPLLALSGNINKETGENVTAKVKVFDNISPMGEMQGSNYVFSNLEQGNSYRVQPERDFDVSNGVTTFDIALISKHILDLQSFTSPYQMIAADVNRDGEIDGEDMLLIRNLILRRITRFPNNTAWRFIPKSFVFRDNKNPFADDFPEILNLNNITTDINKADFVAVKIGDVNLTSRADASALTTRDSRPTEAIYLNDKKMEAGKEYIVDLNIHNNSLEALQVALKWDKTKVESFKINEGNLPQFDKGNFEMNEKGGIFAAAWVNLKKEKLSDDNSIVQIKITPRQSMWLHELVSLDEQAIENLAYDSTTLEKQLQLRFLSPKTDNPIFELYQNSPNPFISETTISFILPEANTAELSIYDVDGRKVYTLNRVFTKGYNEVKVNSSVLKNTGIYFYRLQSDKFTATKRMQFFIKD